MSVTLRLATPDDAPACVALYAPYVRETSITFEYEGAERSRTSGSASRRC